MFELIQESDLDKRSVKNLSTTPTKRTPFGESNLSSEELKEKFDRMPKYIAERVNEIFRGIYSGDLADHAMVNGLGANVGFLIRSIYDGSGAKKIKIPTPTGEVTLEAAIGDLVKLLDEIENGEIAETLNVIQNVQELPRVGSDKLLYRLQTARMIHNQYPVVGSVCHAVEELPNVGTDVMSGGYITAYYRITDGTAWGYVGEASGETFGVDFGWYSAEVLLQKAGYQYGGVISSLDEDPMDSRIRIQLMPKLYAYNGGKWSELDNDELEARIPLPTKRGNWAYTTDVREDGVPRQLHILISHSINDAVSYQIPLREKGIIKCEAPISEKDCANKGYVDALGEAVLSGLETLIKAQNEILRR